MSNSSLVNYTLISPNKNPRKNNTYNPSGKVTKITIHHTAGVTTVERLGSTFSKESRQASSNYGIGSDGRVGLYVPEDHRAWTSGSRTNDYQSVTIELSNSSTGGNWPVSDLVLEKLIDLCVDICKRNGIEKLNFTGNAYGNLTMHKYFEATTCPGPYLESKFPFIAEEVNKRLAPVKDTALYRVTVEGLPKAQAENLVKTYENTGIKARVEVIAKTEPVKPAEPAWVPDVGDIVNFKGGNLYGNSGAVVGSIAQPGQAKITKTAPGKMHPYHLVRTGKTGPYGWVDAGTFTKV